MASISSGVDQSWGQFAYEQNSKLRGVERFDIFEKMGYDPHIAAALRLNRMPLQNAEITFEPASDKPQDKEIAEFCAANLLRESTDRFGKDHWVQTPWKSQRLFEVLSFLEYGFSAFNATWRRVGTRVVYDRLQWLEPSSIDRWKMDDRGQLIGIERCYTRPTKRGDSDEAVTREFIDATRLKLYTWEFKGERYEGRPFIRSMYGAWLRKDHFLRMSAIWAQKAGAPNPFGSYPADWDKNTIDTFNRFMEDQRGTANDLSFGSFPMGEKGEKPEIGWAGQDGSDLDKMRGLINGENAELAHGGGQKSMLLGETASGSRALGDSQGRIEMGFVNALATIIEEWEMHGVSNVKGVVEELVDRNFANVQAYPRFKFANVNPYEGLENIDKLATAKGAGLVPNHPKLRRQVTEQFGYVLPDEAYEIDPTPVGPLPQGTPQPGAGAGQDGSGDGDANPSEDPAKPGTNSSRKKEDVSGGGRVAASLSAAEFKAQIAAMLEPYDG